ncbi:MAG: hypothetical protein QXE25_02795 [Nitrososphaerota archaeon]
MGQARISINRYFKPVSNLGDILLINLFGKKTLTNGKNLYEVLHGNAIRALGVLTVAIWTFVLLMSFINVQLPHSPPLVIIEEPTIDAATSPSPYINTLVVLIIIAVGGAIFVSILIYAPRIASYISMIIFGLVTFLSLTLYTLLLSYRVGMQMESSFVTLCLGLAVLLTWLIRRGRGVLPIISAAITAAAGGVLMGMMLPPVTAILLLSAMSIFDLLMVKKGYLSVLNKEDLREKIMLIKGMIVNYDNLTIGLGDLVFYSILVSNMYFQYGFWPAVLSNLGILIGFNLTLLYLKRSGTAPGLTIPIILGLLLALASQFLL